MELKLSRKEMLKMLSGAGLATMVAPFSSLLSTNEAINTKPIPSSGEPLPVVGLGTWQQFDVGPSASARQSLQRVLQSMIQKGGKLIDSSPMYGRAEKVVGDLAHATDSPAHFFYATKVWTRGREAGIRQMNSSLQKMQVDTMDLMQVHNLMDWQTHLDTLKDWKADGKIRYIGITHYRDSAHSQLEKIIKDKHIDFVQFNYSIRNRHAEKSLLQTAQDNGVATIINRPYEGGSLFRAVRGKELPPWVADYGIESWGQFFLKYIIAHPGVNCVIPGTSDPKHLLDNMGAGFGRIPDAAARKKMVQYLETI